MQCFCCFPHTNFYIYFHIKEYSRVGNTKSFTRGRGQIVKHEDSCGMVLLFLLLPLEI